MDDMIWNDMILSHHGQATEAGEVEMHACIHGDVHVCILWYGGGELRGMK